MKLFSSRTSASEASTIQLTRKRRAVPALAAVVTLTLSLVAGVVVAAPANAATFNYESATICYTYSNGAPYTQATYDMQYVGSTWVRSQAFAGTSNGCRAWKLTPGYYYSFYAYKSYQETYTYGVYFWSGYAPVIKATAGVIYREPTMVAYETAY